ncbi:hypothetical protein ACOCEA_04910 [Maribacter sp. CXY002]|uniref:hypothetical protein n=1 Tax=Maribacter luteocoastalis TaxID=3407671 RepID=UPI003B684C8B
MNLKTERKVKFWLGTLAKAALVVLIIFKIYDFVTSRKNENKSVESTSDIVEKDTLNRVGEISKEIPSENVSRFMNDPDNNKQKEELVATINPNSISIIIYGVNGIDQQIINHLENTIFQKYDLSATPSKALDYKSALVQGNFSGFSKIKTNYMVAGEVRYTFKKSSLSSNTVSCQINLQFNTYDTTTDTKMRDLSKIIQVNGIGFSQEEAKANAIKKI